MKLDLTPEQAFFHGTTRQFLEDKVPTSPAVTFGQVAGKSVLAEGGQVL